MKDRYYPEYDEYLDDDFDMNILCNQHDIQKMKAIKRRENKAQRDKSRRQNGKNF